MKTEKIILIYLIIAIVVCFSFQKPRTVKTFKKGNRISDTSTNVNQGRWISSNDYIARCGTIGVFKIDGVDTGTIVAYHIIGQDTVETYNVTIIK